MHKVIFIIKLYWPLIKSLQTGLLVITGLAGFMSARCPILYIPSMVGLFLSLAASISGSTILNMWWDRDIDEKMCRTQSRPLAAGRISRTAAFWVGLGLSTFGVGLAVFMQPLYGLVVFSGFFFNVVIYTIWLKRRTCWSIVWGGVAGGMPILAGRVLGSGGIDSIGILLSLGILFWIPTHILTFTMRYHEDYQRAKIPTFPSRYGFNVTRMVISISSVLAAFAVGGAAFGLGLAYGFLRLLAVLSVGLLLLAAAVNLKPSDRASFGLFKYASIYMLSAMIIVILGAA